MGVQILTESRPAGHDLPSTDAVAALGFVLEEERWGWGGQWWGKGQQESVALAAAPSAAEAMRLQARRSTRKVLREGAPYRRGRSRSCGARRGGEAEERARPLLLLGGRRRRVVGLSVRGWEIAAWG